MISFLASPTRSSFPPAVIHLNPPNKITTTATMPKNPRAMLISCPIDVCKSAWPRPVSSTKVDSSPPKNGEVSTCACKALTGIASANTNALIMDAFERNFFIDSIMN
ncbi:MAG: hypothetical protein ACD_76C00066G0001 [uncultured bacterium]|nr:MAG: hypothetical protein ACD_76C00066G0001 [uncultured bacterium]